MTSGYFPEIGELERPPRNRSAQDVLFYVLTTDRQLTVKTVLRHRTILRCGSDGDGDQEDSRPYRRFVYINRPYGW